ncbi:MAG: tRNA (adenosine(37)-N6)-threonylcarbamoyltransferase complex dimerization subunit type 1 TsaB [Pseudomonadota bacterium]
MPTESLPTILAIDTATEALSLALLHRGERRALHRVMPRQQQQQLFPCLEELLDGTPPGDLGLDAIAFGRGPGSFTGLRIATSAAQGLAFALAIPVLGVSTLETQVRSWWRHQNMTEDCFVVSGIDARIGQTYFASYIMQDGRLRSLGPARLAVPAAIPLQPHQPEYGHLPRYAVGSGLRPAGESAPGLVPLQGSWPEVLPEAEDMLDPALALLAAGEALPAEAAVPDYVQKRIGWKTLAEQGRRA